MDTREDELEAFKSRIDLRDYVAANGYDYDPRHSSVNSPCFRRGDEKIFIGVGHDGHWVYWAVHDPADQGSIIDFVQQRGGGNLGQVRRELRPWVRGGSTVPTARAGASTHPLLHGKPQDFGPKPEPVVTNLEAVRAEYQAAHPVPPNHPYLAGDRGLPTALLASPRFAGRMRIGDYGNVLFPHYNADKRVCGFEKKNRGFTGFASGGDKGLWCSAPGGENDRRMVVAETAIDALSYAALFGYEDARFFSIAGQMNPKQPGLLNRAMQAMPTGSEIVAAVDHDDGGEAIAELIELVYQHVSTHGGREDLVWRMHHPPTAGQDWNDVLRDRPALSKADEPGLRP